jgi:hypothetical protein
MWLKDLDDNCRRNQEEKAIRANISFFAFTATPKSKTIELIWDNPKWSKGSI